MLRYFSQSAMGENTEITHYTMLYSRGNRTAGEHSHSVDIEWLSGNTRSYVCCCSCSYINVKISGERSAIPFTLPSSSSDKSLLFCVSPDGVCIINLITASLCIFLCADVCSVDVSIAVVVTFLLTIILHYAGDMLYVSIVSAMPTEPSEGNNKDHYSVMHRNRVR